MVKRTILSAQGRGQMDQARLSVELALVTLHVC